MQKSERWGGDRGPNSGNPSARLRAARSMPHWMESRGGLPTPPPPPPPAHPEPEIPLADPDYEVIDVPTQNYSNTPLTTIEVRVRRCELCGASGPSVLCEQCPQQSFCPSCDEMYHRHPKRQSHMRRAILDSSRPGEPPRPPLPPKGEGLVSPAPVPPPRRNKKNLLPPGSSSTLKRETGIMGSIKKMITGKTPPRPPSMSRDRSASMINNNMDFHGSNQMMMGGMEPNAWSRGRVGSMTALNMPPQFGPMMHAQSMAHMGCPGCWGWGSQAALHQAGMQGPHMHGMPPPPPQPYWYPSWDPRRQRRHHHHGRPPADSSSEDDDRPSPALSRRSIRAVDSDSDESFKKSRPHSRRESFADLRRRDDDTRSIRGSRFDDDTRSLRGERRDSLRRREDMGLDRGTRRNRRFDDTMSERGGRRMDDTMSERGGFRRRQEDLFIDDKELRRRDDDTFSERGGRRAPESKYRDDSWDRHSRKPDKIETKPQRESSIDKLINKRGDRYLIDSDSDKKSKPIDKRQDKVLNHLKKDSKKDGPSSTKSSETLSSVVSSTSGEDRGRWTKKDRVFSDTGQKRRATLDNNAQFKTKDNLPDEKPKINGNEENNTEGDDDMKPLGSIPTSEWECKHCTFVNGPGSRVCEVCCKTRTVDTDTELQENIEEEINEIETKFADIKVKEEVKDTKEVSKPKELEESKEVVKRVEPKPETEELPKKKEPLVEATTETQPVKNIIQTSKGTSPPPQSISTQTYDVAGLGVKKPSPEIGWSSPRRSFSRQSLVSETAQSGISPSRSRSPVETDSQITESRQPQPRRNDLPSALTRKPSRASSLANEQTNTMVQKQVNQGLEMVKLLREAEDVGFSGEEVSVAVEHCGDGSPLQWLLDNWTHMIDTVVTLATNYGHERKENTIGTVSEREARAALIQHQGSVWSAVTEVVQQRQNKYGELLSRGNFSREDIVTALTAHRGDLEAAYIELTKGQLKPFLRRMWAPSNHIVEETEQQKVDWDPSGRVQSWLTQHVYQSLPKPKLPTASTRRHSDVHRFLNEVFSGQTSQPSVSDSRYASLHSLAGKVGRIQSGNEFGAPPERYMSCLNLYEASTRQDMTPRLYSKQQKTPYFSKTFDDTRSLKLSSKRTVPDYIQEYKDKIHLDRQHSAPDEYLLERIDSLLLQQLGLELPAQQMTKWKNTDVNMEVSGFQRMVSDSQTDERSEYFDDTTRSDDVIKDNEEEAEAQDQVYNGRLQLLIQQNHKRKRRPRRNIKNYHNKFHFKSEPRHSKHIKEEHTSKIEQKRDNENEEIKNNKNKKDSTDEYESIESSEDDIKEKKVIQDNSTALKTQNNERLDLVQKETSSNNKNQVETIKVSEEEFIKYHEPENVEELDAISDSESIDKSVSEEIIEGDFREPDASFAHSIPFIDEEDEEYSDASEDVVQEIKRIVVGATKTTKGNKSDDSSNYMTPLDNSEVDQKLVKSNINKAENTNATAESKNSKKNLEKNKSLKENININKGITENSINSNSKEEIIPQTSVTHLVNEQTNRIGSIDQIEEVTEEESDEEYEYIEVEQETLDRLQTTLTVLPEGFGIAQTSNEMLMEIETKKSSLTQNRNVEAENKNNKSVKENKITQLKMAEENSKQEVNIESKTITKPNENKKRKEEVVNKKQELAIENKNIEVFVKTENKKAEITNTKIKGKNANESKKGDKGFQENNKREAESTRVKTEASVAKNKQPTETHTIQTDSNAENPEDKEESNNAENEIDKSKEEQNNFQLEKSKLINKNKAQDIKENDMNRVVPDKANINKIESQVNLEEYTKVENQYNEASTSHDVNTSEQTIEPQEQILGNNVTVEVTGEIEKGLSDEKTKEKESHSDGSTDNSRLTAFASGNLKTKIRVDVERLSPVVDGDESSDIDVSPIPTDSEGDKSRNKNNAGIIEEKKLVNKHEEMVTLIKESLSKDVVLDRLVGTILGVLQGNGAQNLLREQELTSIFRQEETVKEIPMTDNDGGMVTALQLVQDINLNPKEALQETILQCDVRPKDAIQIKNEEFQREVRKVLAEGLVTSNSQAELVVNLIELKFTPEEAVQAATECTTLQSAISFLHQECPLCANKCTIKQIIGLLECDHRCCKECAFNYFNLQVTEGSVLDCVCPFCRMPNLKTATQDQAQLYFSHLDILLKGLLPEPTHELFQRKLRDWTLAQDPLFKWCTKCSSGFIADPNQKVLMCPDCRFITCAKCRKPWEGGHEASCEELAEQIEPENLLNKHLEEEGITCPACRARYTLARGGCMHMTCTGCKHEFCSGCSKPFLMGDACKVSEYCVKLGLHAHHPRNCLFYLRDKEPQVLEQLLKDNGVDYRREETEINTTGRCKVSILKETDDGMLETECNYPIHAQALCRTHFVEHLVRLVKAKKLDPATVMDLNEAQQELRRRGKQLPDRLPRQCDQSYLLALIKVVQEQIPLE